MTEKELQILGFVKETMYGYEDEEDPDYYYFFDVVNGITFISQSKNQVIDNNWTVDFFNTDPVVRFDKMEKVQSLINTISKAVVSDEK